MKVFPPKQNMARTEDSRPAAKRRKLSNENDQSVVLGHAEAQKLAVKEADEEVKDVPLPSLKGLDSSGKFTIFLVLPLFLSGLLRLQNSK